MSAKSKTDSLSSTSKKRQQIQHLLHGSHQNLRALVREHQLFHQRYDSTLPLCTREEAQFPTLTIAVR